MNPTSPITGCEAAPPTLVPFFAIFNFTLALVAFIAASYFMARETLLEILNWIAPIQPWINFVMIGLSVVLMYLGTQREKHSLLTWGLRSANCVATLSIVAGVLVVIGSTQGGVDDRVMRELYLWQPWFIFFYAVFVGFHAGLQRKVYRARRSQR